MAIKDKIETERYTLYLADCLDVLPTLEAGSMDAVVTDPPYGIGYDASHKKYLGGIDRGIAEWDRNPFDPTAILMLQLQTIIWGGNCFASRLPDFPGWLSWVKINKNGTKIRQAEMELAWTNCVNRPQSFRWTWIGAGMEGEGNAVYGGLVHPCQKPVALMEWCIDFTKSECVLDPYMGSGTTGVACMKLGRKFIGIEIDEKYFAIAAKRIKEAAETPMLYEIAEKAEQGSMFSDGK